MCKIKTDGNIEVHYGTSNPSVFANWGMVSVGNIMNHI